MPYAPKTHRPAHATAPRKRVDHRKPSSQRGYAHGWPALRDAYRQQHPLCEDCAAAPSARWHEVDHVIPITGTDDPLRLLWPNLRTRCRQCHAAKTARYDDAIRAEYDRTGDAEGTIARWRQVVARRSGGSGAECVGGRETTGGVIF